MKRIAGLFGAILLVAAFGAPVVLAADEELPTTGRVVMASAATSRCLPASRQMSFVANGDADIAGTVNSLTVIDGTRRSVPRLSSTSSSSVAAWRSKTDRRSSVTSDRSSRP